MAIAPAGPAAGSAAGADQVAELLQLVDLATGLAGVLQLVAARILGGRYRENAIRFLASRSHQVD